MADMGFMPQVEWDSVASNGTTRPCCSRPPWTVAVDRLVSRYMTDPVLHEVASPTTTVEAMEHRFLEVHQMDRVKVCAAICRSADKVLVFVRTKHAADRLVEQLGKENVRAVPARRPAPGPTRADPQDFTEGKLHVLVATTWAATGPAHRRRRRRDPLDPPEDHKAYRTVRAAPPAPGPPASWCRWSSGTRSSRSSASRPESGSACRSSRCLERPPARRPGRLGSRGVLSPPPGSARRNRPRPPPARPAAPHPPHHTTPHPEERRVPDRSEPLTIDDVPTTSADLVVDRPSRRRGLRAPPAPWPRGPAGASTCPTASPPTATPEGPTTPSRGPRWPPPPRGAVGGGPRRRGHRRDVPGIPDGRVTASLELRAAISRVIRLGAPDASSASRRSGTGSGSMASHPDHLAPPRRRPVAVYPDARNPFAFPSCWTKASSRTPCRAGGVMATERANRGRRCHRRL